MSNDDKSVQKVPGEISPDDREAIRKRAAELGDKLDTAKRRHAPPPSNRAKGEAMAMGFRAASELIGGVVVGSGIGWLLDRWLGTWPGFFILFFLLGAAAGMLGIIRMAQRQTTPPAPSVPRDRDDGEND